MLLGAKFTPPFLKRPGITKIILAMRLAVVLQLALCLQISAKTYSQKISISTSHAPLKTVLHEIEVQSGYQFFFKEKVLKLAGTVDAHFTNADIRDVLNQCLKPKGLTYDIVDKIVVIREAPVAAPAAGTALSAPLSELKGIIKDEQGVPLPGASIRLKGTARGTSTNAEGQFTLSLPDNNATLEVSFVGYETQEVPVNGQSSITIILKRREIKGDEIVVVGYGTQKKSQLIGSVSQISSKEINNRPVTQLSQALTGQMPGVTVIQRSGQPGTGNNIQIRGVGSFGASSDALILVDGIPTASYNDIDPNDVESISVLKDASSAAIYGARAANGVILITTKTGNAKKLRISLNSYVGQQKITSTPKFVNSWEYATLMNEAQPGSYTGEQIQKFKDGSDPDNYPNVNYFDASLKKNFLQTGHNLSLSNGNDKTQYLISAGFLDQDGVVKGNNYKRYNARLNLETKINDRLKLNTRFSMIQSNRQEPNTPATLDATGMQDIISNVIRYTPNYPIRMSNGDWGVGNVNKGNPVAWLNSGAFYNNRSTDLNGNLRLDWFVITDLKLSLIGGYTQSQTQDKTFLATQRINDNIFLGPSNLSQGSGFSSYKTIQATADYHKQIARHEIAVLGGYSFESTHYEDLTAARNNLPSNDLTVLGLGDPGTQTNNSSATEYALKSFFGRFQYNYNRKYLFEANMRYDGSSRFPKNDKYAFFPSMAAGWRISEENFIKDRFHWLNELKLKASYGTLGNQNLGSNYPYQNILVTGFNYPIGNVVAPGAVRTTINDSTIHWESTRTKDLGLEAAFFQQKLAISISYFDRYTYDILVSPTTSVSGVLGASVGQQNSGKLKNTGWEFTATHRNSIGKFNYNVGANFSIINNKVLDLGVGNIHQANGLTGNGSTLFVGYPMSLYYGYETDGLFTDAADVAAWKANNDMTAISPNPKPGDIRYKDISGPDGKPDGKVTADYDRKVLGSTIPKYTYGITLGGSYKGFDLNVLLQGVSGVNGYLNNYAGWAFYQNGNVQRWQMDERWTADNPNPQAKYPRLELISNQGTANTLTSSYWVLNGSYLRLKNIQIGYSFPKDLLRRANIEGLRLSLGAENIYTWSNYRAGWDPEVNTGGAYYPILANYTLGLNLNF
ncbi:TonB-dependent receptor [Chitinophaga sp. RAB17]|uniref:TonB-dependent receptor n=1 Tax=Chitinophaga sp. RAB17 TaxID=3233049 RepID=UPI003F8EE529